MRIPKSFLIKVTCERCMYDSGLCYRVNIRCLAEYTLHFTSTRNTTIARLQASMEQSLDQGIAPILEKEATMQAVYIECILVAMIDVSRRMSSAIFRVLEKVGW